LKGRWSVSPKRAQKELLDKIGTGDGQVLGPIQRQVNQVSQMTSERLGEVKRLLADELDPARESSSLGKALRELKNLVDAKRNDSIQGSFETALTRVTGEDGVLAKSVRAVVSDAIKPLAEEVDRLGNEIHGQEAAIEALAQTIEKGATFEVEIVEDLQTWSKFCGAQVLHVGGDKRPGDVVLKFSPGSITGIGTSLVIETRDHGSPAGRRAIANDMARSMGEREANVGLYLCRSQDGLAKEIGEWAEGESENGPWVATTQQHLITAVRFLLMCRRLAAPRQSRPEIDATAIDSQLRRIRTAMGRVTNINRKAGHIRDTVLDVEKEASALRGEVQAALLAVEDALRLIPGADRDDVGHQPESAA
jgi:hypothetical protein